MFISKTELQNLRERIRLLEIFVAGVVEQKELAEKKKAERKPRRAMSPEARANISAGRIAAYARRKAAQGAV